MSDRHLPLLSFLLRWDGIPRQTTKRNSACLIDAVSFRSPHGDRSLCCNSLPWFTTTLQHRYHHTFVIHGRYETTAPLLRNGIMHASSPCIRNCVLYEFLLSRFPSLLWMFAVFPSDVCNRLPIFIHICSNKTPTTIPLVPPG